MFLRWSGRFAIILSMRMGHSTEHLLCTLSVLDVATLVHEFHPVLL